MLFNALFLLLWCISVTSRYTLYHTNIRSSSSPTFDCLYAYSIDGGKETGKRYVRNYHLIPYCRRADHDAKILNESTNPISENTAKTISFQELKKQNVTSQELLQWFAPIDLAEKYQLNLHDDSDVFHNCSSPWFGSRCQYKFASDFSLSLSDIIQDTLDKQYQSLPNVTSGTCYRFLTGCNRRSWPLCLDWREICDGKIDCLNGEDEEWCEQLEITKCSDNEYRCHYGGQCIPLEFDKDSRSSIDCLDGSDEPDHVMYNTGVANIGCLTVWTFQCQERIGRYFRSYQCGDGQYLTATSIPFDFTRCNNEKEKKSSRIILTSMDHIPDINCGKAFYCALHSNRTFGSTSLVDVFRLIPVIEDVRNEDCEPLSKYCASEWLVIPEHPTLFGFFQFVYLTNRSVEELKRNVAPDFVCFNAKKCPVLLARTTPIEMVNGLTCSRLSDLTSMVEIINWNFMIYVFSLFDEQCLTIGIDQSCENASYFYCNESMKCIPYHRVVDGISDCYFGEDESFDACQLNDSTRFKCQSDSMKCLSPVTVGDGFRNCPEGEDEVLVYFQNSTGLLSFPDLCNLEHGFHFSLLNITETDETNCEGWPCDNSYTHCDGDWDCRNGADELNCPDSKCSLNEHQCYNARLGLSYCASLAHTYEKYLDYCNDSFQLREVYFSNGTMNISEGYFSWNDSKCITADIICRNDPHFQTSLAEEDICLYQSGLFSWTFEKVVQLFPNNEYLCGFQDPRRSAHVHDRQFFTSRRLGYFPEISMNSSLPPVSKANEKNLTIPNMGMEFSLYCHRGIVLLSGPNERKVCLCPPNYFGSQCQWQSQRISLTLQLHWRSSTSTIMIFQVVIMLIDQDGEITPYHEEVTYVPSRDCDTKFNIYLLYPDRPKSLSKNYSIRIDLYEKTKLNYWSSWFLPIPFPFLPVNRMVSQLFIPELENNEQCTLSCGEHGQCRAYISRKSSFFCQCDEGYSGHYCNTTYKRNCANDSWSLHSSICVCPLHKFGRYCSLTHSICHSSNNPCEHNGLCIPTDDRIHLAGFTCFCSSDYSGERCQNKKNRIIVHLDQSIGPDSSLFLAHFITAFKDAEHERITVLKKIPFGENTLSIEVTQSFNLLFLQIPDQDYYLAVVRERFLPSEDIDAKIDGKRRCPSINELVNSTFLRDDYFRQIKSYPLLCRRHNQLVCFHDKNAMCICDGDRFSNCFLFNHARESDCQRSSYCQNAGQCFQNNETCPTKFLCVCPDCYYGTRCQLSTDSLMFSLDAILGYHIQPNLSLSRQPSIIQISIAISTIMLLTGLINGFLSIITFRRTVPRQVGSGNYLFASSISSVTMIIFLTIKFWELIFSQMSLITNRSFLYFNCISTDVILRILLASSEWLNACVALERMVSVIQVSRFQKKKSREISKWVISSVFLLTTVTHIHDPMHRQLIDDIDIDQSRIWCFVQYSSSVNIYNSFITLFHFLGPFLINIISALWIILSIARRRSSVQPDQTFQQHFKRQLQQHQHLLITSALLIFLSLPRLIISFLSGCMRSARQPWLYLIGYFLSFSSSLVTFFVFVSPSEHYKTEFKTAVGQVVRRFRTN